jgi:hypothetical protein
MATRSNHEYAKNASKLHKLVGDTLRSSDIFSGYEIHQEYPASRVNPRLSSRLHYDWAIPRLHLVIECHGEQHYRPVAFGGVDAEVALDNYHATKRRDHIKREGALYAGWAYIEIPYDSEVSESAIYRRYVLAKQEAESYNEVMDKVVRPEKGEYHQKQLEKARQYRKERYQRQKEWKKKHGP